MCNFSDQPLKQNITQNKSAYLIIVKPRRKMRRQHLSSLQPLSKREHHYRGLRYGATKTSQEAQAIIELVISGQAL
jgi:hypothetical protein